MASVLPSASAPAASPSVAWLADATRMKIGDRHRYLLVLRFALINIVGLSLLGAAYFQGYVDAVIAADGTRLSIVIAAAFLVGLAICASRVVQTSNELNLARDFDPAEAAGGEADGDARQPPVPHDQVGADAERGDGDVRRQGGEEGAQVVHALGLEQDLRRAADPQPGERVERLHRRDPPARLPEPPGDPVPRIPAAARAVCHDRAGFPLVPL